MVPHICPFDSLEIILLSGVTVQKEHRILLKEKKNRLKKLRNADPIMKSVFINIVHNLLHCYCSLSSAVQYVFTTRSSFSLTKGPSS